MTSIMNSRITVEGPLECAASVARYVERVKFSPADALGSLENPGGMSFEGVTLNFNTSRGFPFCAFRHDFSDATLLGVTGDLDLRHCGLRRATIKVRGGVSDYPTIDMRSSDARGLTLRGSARVFADSANLGGSNLRLVDFYGSSFVGTDFKESDSSTTHFWGCDMRRADFRGLPLSPLQFHDCRNLDEMLWDGLFCEGYALHQQAEDGEWWVSHGPHHMPLGDDRIPSDVARRFEEHANAL